jgi:hypothetical protein
MSLMFNAARQVESRSRCGINRFMSDSWSEISAVTFNLPPRSGLVQRPELSDAVGPARPNWQRRWPARVRSSDLIWLDEILMLILCVSSLSAALLSTCQRGSSSSQPCLELSENGTRCRRKRSHLETALQSSGARVLPSSRMAWLRSCGRWNSTGKPCLTWVFANSTT